MTPYSTRKPISLFVVLLSLTAAGCDEGTAQNAPTVASSSTAANRVEIRGRLTAVDPPSRMVRVTDTAVLVPVGATIRRGATPLAFATLSVGDEVDIEAAVVGAILTATEVDVRTDNAGPGSIPPAAVELGEDCDRSPHFLVGRTLRPGRARVTRTEVLEQEPLLLTLGRSCGEAACDGW